MGLFKKEYSPTNPTDILTNIFRTMSGDTLSRTLRYNIFYKIVAFKGVKDGLGCSTIVANTALALAKAGINVCVVDTSILNPCQNDLLHTNYMDINERKQEDWFTLGHTEKTVLNQSRLNSRISVLAFKNRTIVDLASTLDSDALVSLAYSQLATKFDIILVDVCAETSNICMASMQYAHKIIQVWSNAPHVMKNVDEFIKNTSIMSIPLNKMRYVITSMTVDDISMDWKNVLNQYKFKHLAHVGMSLEIARILATGKMMYEFASNSKDVQEFNECILDIVAHLVLPTKDIKEVKMTDLDNMGISDGRLSGVFLREHADTSKDFPEVSWQTKEGNEERQMLRDVAEQIELGGDS